MSPDRAFAMLTSLSEDLRRGLYRFVHRQDHPVTRAEAGRAMRISTKLAAFHLDKLVAAGLLRAVYDTPPDRPRRVGRTPKRYTPSEVEVSLSVPDRRYEFIGEVLVDALTRSPGGGEVSAAARRTAWERGHELGAAARAERRLGRPGTERTMAVAEDLLAAHGFEPAVESSGGLQLRNCPFRRLASRAPETICAVSTSFVDGIVRGLGNDGELGVRVDAVPVASGCCVRLRPPPPVGPQLR
jgi:predicted ArsR family transcriptional regulator